MTEASKTPKETLSTEWKENMRMGVTETLANYELFEQINFAPISLVGEDDPRIWRELNSEEKEWITKQLFKEFGFNRRNEVVLKEYSFEPPQADDIKWKGEAKVKVFETHRTKLENMCLHEIIWPDNEIEFVIAPQDTQI